MGMSGDNMAAEILALMELEGVFDVIEDDEQREAARAKTLAGLKRITSGIVAHIQTNAVINIPAGAVVLDDFDVPIGSVSAHAGGIE